MNLKEVRERLVRVLLASERTKVEEILNEAKLEQSPTEIAEFLITPVLDDIGEMWKEGEASLSQVYMSSRICEDFLDSIMPSESPMRMRQPKIAIVTLEDHHTLGKKIVYATIRANGFEVDDYGTMDVQPLVDQISKNDVQMLLISTLMLRSALRVKVLKEALNKKGKMPFILVGGAPFIFDPTLWKEIGADAGSQNSNDAIKVIHAHMDGDLK